MPQLTQAYIHEVYVQNGIDMAKSIAWGSFAGIAGVSILKAALLYNLQEKIDGGHLILTTKILFPFCAAIKAQHLTQEKKQKKNNGLLASVACTIATAVTATCLFSSKDGKAFTYFPALITLVMYSYNVCYPEEE